MDYFVACHRISRNPDGLKEFTGRYDADGEPIVRALVETIMPGGVFKPADAADGEYLLSLEAMRPLTDDELTLYQSGKQTEFAPRLDEAPEFSRQRAS